MSRSGKQCGNRVDNKKQSLLLPPFSFFCTFCSSFLFFFDMVNLLLDDFLVAVAVSSTSISSVRSSLHLVVAIFHCIGFRSTFQLIFFSRLVPGYVESDMWVHSMAKFSAVRRFPWGRFFLVFGCSHIDIVLSPKSRMVACGSGGGDVWVAVWERRRRAIVKYVCYVYGIFLSYWVRNMMCALFFLVYLSLHHQIPSLAAAGMAMERY